MNCLQLYDDRMVNINTNKLVKSHHSCKYTSITFDLFIYIILKLLGCTPQPFSLLLLILIPQLGMSVL